jgi:competence protein ComEA
MPLDSRLNTKIRLVGRTGLVLALGWAVLPAWAQLPPGPGREETQKMCSGCHEFERSISLRQDRDGWKATINKMLNFGAQSTDEEFTAVLEYLSTNYPAEVVPRLNVNTAKAIDFESRLSLKRSEAALVIQYREKHGNFKSVEDLKKVPGIDAAKVEAKRNILVF